MQAISNYHWPGNIRALRHAIERAVILSESKDFEAKDFQVDSAATPDGAVRGEVIQVETDQSVNLELNLERLEKRAIQQSLTRHRYNITHAAKELGLTRAALYRRMEKHGL